MASLLLKQKSSESPLATSLHQPEIILVQIPSSALWLLGAPCCGSVDNCYLLLFMACLCTEQEATYDASSKVIFRGFQWKLGFKACDNVNIFVIFLSPYSHDIFSEINCHSFGEVIAMLDDEAVLENLKNQFTEITFSPTFASLTW